MTRAWLRPRNFRSRLKISLSRQDVMGLCSDRLFSIVTEFCQVQRVSCRDRIFLGHNRVWPRQKGFVLRQGILCRDRVCPRSRGLLLQQSVLCRDKVWLGKKFSCHDRVGNGGEILCRNRVFPRLRDFLS